MIKKTDQQWREQLNAEQYRVCREKGTEMPFSGELLKNTKVGQYLCVCCDAPLFSSETKFESHCGWPSFFEGIEDKIRYQDDFSHRMQRVEILCKNCDAHLGHVFTDGPEPTGKRYCVNSVSMRFEAASDTQE